MKTMLDVSIRFKLHSPSGGHYALDVCNDRFGVLSYQLYGWKGHTPYALSNAGMKYDLPATVHKYGTLQELMADLILAIDSGYYEIETIVFQLAKEVPNDNL